jgi:hypothetical protein
VSSSEGSSTPPESLLTALLLLQMKNHPAPITITKHIIETLIPIKRAGLLVADEARLLREGAVCNIVERTAKAMGAMLTVRVWW